MPLFAMTGWEAAFPNIAFTVTGALKYRVTAQIVPCTSIIAGGTQAGKKKDIFDKICRDGSLYCNMSRIRYWWNTLSG